MMQNRSILFLILSAATVLPVAAAPGPYPITAERIATAVTASGFQVSPDQVSMLTKAVASVADPELKVSSIAPGGSHRAIARVECAAAEQCLPFIVILHTTGDNPANAIPSAVQTSAASKSQAPIFAVRAGKPATLLLDSDHVHISLSVICLENGAPGQTIRVSSRDRRQTYTVQVTEDGTLRGRL